MSEHWLYELIDGLARYEAEHPQDGWCLEELLKLVPADLRTEGPAYMRGWKAAVAAQTDEEAQRKAREA